MSDNALFTHHHYGWRKHDLPNSHHDHLIAALIDTHGFLTDADCDGRYRVEIERTPACSYDGVVRVFWDHDEPRHGISSTLHRGDYWFRAFEFNVAPVDACRFCGGTGMDHYDGPFFHCWACDGDGKQVRKSVPRGFKKKPTVYPETVHERRKA